MVYDGTRFSDIAELNEPWGLGTPRSLAQDRDGVVWLGDLNGLIRVANGRIQRIQWTTEKGGKTAIAGVFSLFSEGNRSLLVGARTGMYQWDGRALQLAGAPPAAGTPDRPFQVGPTVAGGLSRRVPELPSRPAGEYQG